jgi:hypothetical protein
MRNAAVRYAAVAILVLGASAPMFGDQSLPAPPNPEANKRLGALRPPDANNPYRRLFEARQGLEAALQQQVKTVPVPKRKVVCGMTVIEADPSIDPRMAVTPPAKGNAEHTIRAIDPPHCNAAGSAPQGIVRPPRR